MARAYICIARDDLPSIGDSDEVALKITDLKPRSQDAGRNINGPYGQAGGFAYLCDYAAVASPASGAGFRTTAVERLGLTGYLLDTVHSDPGGGNDTLSDADALTISAWVATQVAGGAAITTVLFNAACLAAVGGATGIAVGNSTATLEQILRIAAGEIYVLPAGIISGAGAAPAATTGGAFVAALFGHFATAANVVTGGGVRGRGLGTPITAGTPTQTAPQNVAFRNARRIYDTGDLHRSILNGQLSDVLPDTWTWVNSEFTYGGGAAPASDVAGNNIAAGGASRACTTYDALGNVL